MNKLPESITQQIAQQEGIELTQSHWVVIHKIQESYAQTQLMPGMRALVNTLKNYYKEEKGEEKKGTSVYLHKLFPKGAKQMAKIAGLPKQTRCM